jgi:ABC-type histidine transport system ATPase subunit
MSLNASEKPMLILRDIHKFYGSNEVLKGVSLEVKKANWLPSWGPAAAARRRSCA